MKQMSSDAASEAVKGRLGSGCTQQCLYVGCTSAASVACRHQAALLIITCKLSTTFPCLGARPTNNTVTPCQPATLHGLLTATRDSRLCPSLTRPHQPVKCFSANLSNPQIITDSIFPLAFSTSRLFGGFLNFIFPIFKYYLPFCKPPRSPTPVKCSYVTSLTRLLFPFVTGHLG